MVVPLISARASLGAKRIGLQARAGQRFGGGQYAALEFGIAQAHQHARDIGGGHQVAARAHRTVARHHRRDAAVQQGGQGIHQFVAHRRGAGEEGGDAQQRGGAHHVARQRLSGGAGEMPHDVVLQQLHLPGRERNADVAAHSRVDAVDALAARQQFFQAGAPLGDARARAAGEPHLDACARHTHHVLDRERIGSQGQQFRHNL